MQMCLKVIVEGLKVNIFLQKSPSIHKSLKKGNLFFFVDWNFQFFDCNVTKWKQKYLNENWRGILN